MKKKYLLILIIVLSSLVCAQPTINAASGDMDINDEVIYQNDEQNNQMPQSSFDINDLFLPYKNRHEKAIVQKRQTTLHQAQKRVFLNQKTNRVHSSKQYVTKKLFRSNYQAAVDSQTAGLTASSRTKEIKIYLLLFAGTAGVLVLGIYMGSKFPQWKKQHLKESIDI